MDFDENVKKNCGNFLTFSNWQMFPLNTSNEGGCSQIMF